MFYGVAIALMILATVARSEKLFNLEDDLPEITVQKVTVYQPQFLVINKELVGELESADPEENFQKIKEIRAKYNNWFNADFKREAVKLFTSLPKSLESCDYKSYKTLAKNYLASEGRSHQQGGLRRVDGIVHHYALEHAKKCRPLYADSFKQFLSDVDQKVFQHVTEIFKDLDQINLVKFAKMEYMVDVDMLTTGLAEININIPNLIKIFEALEGMIENEEDKKLLYAQPDEINGGYIMSSKFKTNIYEPYIEKPCLSYTAKSKQVFAPARFDAAIEDQAQKDLLHSTDEAFRQAWVNHRLCQYFLRFTPWDHIEDAVIRRVQKN